MCLCGLILLYHSDLFLSHTVQADSSIEDPVLVGPKSKLMRGKYRLLSVQRNPKFELVLTDVAFKKALFFFHTASRNLSSVILVIPTLGLLCRCSLTFQVINV